MSDVLQGSFGRAWITTRRFATDTRAPGAGLSDVATDWDRPGHKGDFGQTLGAWGVGPGPAVQLPLFGRSYVRDSVGKLAGLVMDPTSYIPGAAVADIGMASSGLGVVDGRAELLKTTGSLEHSSLDCHATLRSVTAQRRAACHRCYPDGQRAMAAPRGRHRARGRHCDMPGLRRFGAGHRHRQGRHAHGIPRDGRRVGCRHCGPCSAQPGAAQPGG